MQELLNRSWVEVDLDKLRHNVKTIKDNLDDGTALMAIVKADAYGHGAEVIADTLQKSGADAFGVSNILEARNLRESGTFAPILILGYTPVKYAKELSENRITQTLVSYDYASELSDAAVEQNVTVDCHVALDTGMGRIGFDSRDTEECCEKIKAAFDLPNLRISGIFTHFAVADEMSDSSARFTELQHERFTNVISSLARSNYFFRLIHCANSATTMYYPEFQHDMVRCGIAIYGLAPGSRPVAMDLRPVMTLKTTVAMVKELRAGEPISYGRTFCCPTDMKIATVPIGYADGYPKSLSNRAVAWFKRRIIHQVGSVCMDQMMFDVTGYDIHEGDEITLFGGDSPITFENLAGISGLSNYEFACGLSRRLPRVYIENGSVINIVDYTQKK